MQNHNVNLARRGDGLQLSEAREHAQLDFACSFVSLGVSPARRDVLVPNTCQCAHDTPNCAKVHHRGIQLETAVRVATKYKYCKRCRLAACGQLRPDVQHDGRPNKSPAANTRKRGAPHDGRKATRILLRPTTPDELERHEPS